MGRWIAVFLVVACFLFLALTSIANQLRAGKGAQVSTGARGDGDNAIREYLIRNPEVIREALMTLGAREEMEKQKRAEESLRTSQAQLLNDADSPAGGNPKGDVTVVEFFDYNCGYCRKVHNYLQDLTARDPDVRIVYKDLPILGPQSMMAAKAALAAARQGKYEAFHHGLMTLEKVDESGVKALATRLQVNYATLQKDMADPRLDEYIARVHGLARNLDISGTPAFVVGQRLLPGAVPLDVLVSLVKEERARLKQKAVEK
jgi:protein-disulfide isomerase